MSVQCAFIHITEVKICSLRAFQFLAQRMSIDKYGIIDRIREVLIPVDYPSQLSLLLSSLL